MPVPAQPNPVQLHRIRFLDHTPSPITALAFAPIPLPPPTEADKGKGKFKQPALPHDELGALVLARDNGDVEIWQWAREEPGGIGNWILEKVLPPTLTHPSISVMALVIRDPTSFASKGYQVPKIADLRLFTAGSDSTELTERCLLTGRILHITPIPSAPIWSLSVSPSHTLLCLSTTAPTLSFLSIPPSGPLEPPPPHLLRCESLPSRTRTVSIAWGPPKVAEVDGERQWIDTYLVTGNSDSSLRKWELPPPLESGRPIGRVALKARAVVEKAQKKGRGVQKASGNQKGTIVWGVGVLADHTIVSSDSLGIVTFWDGASMAQKQSFQAHKADGMCLAIGPGGRTVFTSGPDQRVCQFSSVSTSPGHSRWVQTGSKRIHSHDVRCLAVFPPYTPHAPPINPTLAPVIASGGWDMSLAITPAASSELLVNALRNPLAKPSGGKRAVFEESFSRKMSCYGGARGTSRVDVSRNGRIVVCRKDRGVAVWRVLEEEQGWEKLVDMDLRLRTNLVASAVSDDGVWLAVSDLYETKLFRLPTDVSVPFAPKRVKSFLPTLLQSEELAHLSLGSTGTGSTSLLFTPDSQRLVMGLTNLSTVVVSLSREDGEVTVTDCFAPLVSDGSRMTVGLSRRQQKKLAKEAREARERAKENGDGEADEEMQGEEKAEEDETEEKQEDEASASSSSSSSTGAWIVCLAASEDGQWLATSDLLGRIAIYNLDTMRLHVVLPTLPTAPSAIAFPPTHPSLLAIATPTGSLQFYHTEHRRLLPPTAQLVTLNTTLRTQFTPLQSFSFEPARHSPRSAKVVIWSHDWLCSVRLDMELISRQAGKKADGAGGAGSVTDSGTATPSASGGAGAGAGTSRANRRKRAREAREALEAVSVSGSSDQVSMPMDVSTTASIAGSRAGQGSKGMSGISGASSATDPDFCKVDTDKFRGVVGVDWFAEGEMCVLERPYGDYVGELPPAFWSGRFGSS